MTLKDLGFFTRYAPQGDNPHNVAFFKNERAQDFYDIVKSNPDGDAFFLSQRDGVIVSGSPDLSSLAPDAMRVIAVTQGAELLGQYHAWAQTGDYRHSRYVWDGSQITLKTIPPTPQDVRLEARRRIDATGLSWMVERAATGGKAVPQAITAYAASVRAASNIIEADPPADYRDNRHWPDPPKTG